MSISGSIVLPLLIAEAVCALEDGLIIRKLVSSTFFLAGITTLVQVLVGVRLPVFQGPTGSYIIPIIALNKMNPTRCEISELSKCNGHATVKIIR